MIVKMSSGLYATDFELSDIEDRDNLRSHVENGSVVCIAEDIETFADEMDIDPADIEMVD